MPLEIMVAGLWDGRAKAEVLSTPKVSASIGVHQKRSGWDEQRQRGIGQPIEENCAR